MPRGRDGTGSAAVLPGRPFRRRAQRRAGDVTPTVGRTGKPAIGRGAGARRSQRALIGPWREGAGRARSARAVLSARGRAGLWRPWRRRRSSTCPSLPPICCGMAAPGGTWCRRCWLPATCRPHSQVNCPHALFPVGPGPAAGSRASPRLSLFCRSFPGRLPCAGRAGRAGALRLRVQRAAVSMGRVRGRGAGTHPSARRSSLAALTPCAFPAATSEARTWLSRRTPWS